MRRPVLHADRRIDPEPQLQPCAPLRSRCDFRQQLELLEALDVDRADSGRGCGLELGERLSRPAELDLLGLESSVERRGQLTRGCDVGAGAEAPDRSQHRGVGIGLDREVDFEPVTERRAQLRHLGGDDRLEQQVRGSPGRADPAQQLLPGHELVELFRRHRSGSDTLHAPSGVVVLSLDRDQLIAFFADTFQLDRRILSEELPLFSSALLDSASLVNLVAFLEEKTGLVVEADDVTLDNFDTISAILTFCEARLG